MTVGPAPRLASTHQVVPDRCIVPDPERGQWLLLEKAPVAGALTWTVAGHFPDRARAERAAGLHDSPAVRWMLYDPALGWLRTSSNAWMHGPSAVTQFGQAEAEAIAAAEPSLQLLVVRANGLVTCPDLEAAA